jgi:diketogulonate reductase-like aldo/keto reductase
LPPRSTPPRRRWPSPGCWPKAPRTGLDIAPIPGTKHVARVEENTAADDIELSPAQIETLNNLTPAAGEHHNEEEMAMYER